MSKYISLAVTAVPPYVQYIQELSILSVEPTSAVLTTLRLIDGNTYEVAHDDDSTANRTMCDAITSALLQINSYKNVQGSQEVEMPTIAGVPIEITGIAHA